MLKGGYQILDFKNFDFTDGVGAVFDGIYDKVEGTRKTFLISGFSIRGVERHDIFASPGISGSSFVFNLNYGGYDYTLTIADTDVVTVEEVQVEV